MPFPELDIGACCETADVGVGFGVPTRPLVSLLLGIWTGGRLGFGVIVRAGTGPVLDPGVGATYVPPASGDVAEGVPMLLALAFASFFSSFRLFLSSRACADSRTNVFIFHYNRH